MLTPLILSLAMQSPTVSAGRFEMGERVKLLDVAWLDTKDIARRRTAVTSISAAVGGFFGGKTSDACRALDAATAALEGRTLRASDAVTMRFDPPIIEPGMRAKLQLSWAYLPTESSAIRVQVGAESVNLTPGFGTTMEIDPQKLNPELSRTVEAGYLVPIRVGNQNRGAYISIVKGFSSRLKRLAESDNAMAADLGNIVQRYVEDPKRMEADLPLIQFLFTGEQLLDGRSKVESLENIAYAKANNTVFRAVFPRSLVGKVGAKVTVVIALHGAGGSENLFFESYGRGLAAREALKRDWIFMSPRTGPNAAQDCIDWLQSVRKLTVGHVVVMGHSMGGGVALGSGKLTPKPSAVALMAPAAGSAPKSATELPIFLSVGKQEMGALKAGIQSLAREWQNRKDFEYKEYDPCEHLMVVADALPDAFAFFDRYVKGH